MYCVLILCAGEETAVMPWYLKLQWLLYNIVTTDSLMVTVWYWSALYKSKNRCVRYYIPHDHHLVLGHSINVRTVVSVISSLVRLVLGPSL